jgi:hypothetical protein
MKVRKSSNKSKIAFQELELPNFEVFYNLGINSDYEDSIFTVLK